MPSLKPPRYSSNRTKGAIRQSPEGLDRKGSSLYVLSCGANATNDLLQQLDPRLLSRTQNAAFLSQVHNLPSQVVLGD